MNEAEFNEKVKRLKMISEAVGDLDPAVKADAVRILEPYATGLEAGAPPDGSDNGPGSENEAGEVPAADTTEDELVDKFESEVDHENAMLALALACRRHGRGPFEMPFIKGVAAERALPVSARLDNFFKTAKREDSIVLRKQADGWKITPSGAKWLQNTYGIKPGKKPIPAPEASK